MENNGMSESVKSEFNMALATLQRVNILLQTSAEFTQDRRLHEWYDILLVLKKELSYLFDSGEKKINKEYEKKINPLDNQYQNLTARGKLHKFQKFEYFYALLESYEKFLRKSLHKRQMLLVGKSESKLF